MRLASGRRERPPQLRPVAMFHVLTASSPAAEAARSPSGKTTTAVSAPKHVAARGGVPCPKLPPDPRRLIGPAGDKPLAIGRKGQASDRSRMTCQLAYLAATGRPVPCDVPQFDAAVATNRQQTVAAEGQRGWQVSVAAAVLPVRVASPRCGPEAATPCFNVA